MIDKIVAGAAAAVHGIEDGFTLLIGGFGDAGMPHALIDALIEKGNRDLTLVTNNAGVGHTGIARLLKERRVRKIVCSFPRSAGSVVFDEMYARGEVDLELVPQGTLSERIRAGSAGIGGFYVKTGAGTLLAVGKETRDIDGERYLLEFPIKADAAFIKARCADRWGNLTYHSSARNFGPIMAPAARLTIAQVRDVVPLGGIDPEHVVTPGIFIDRVWQCPE